MTKAEEDKILRLLKHDGAAFRTQGITLCIEKKETTPLIAKALMELKEDKVIILGRPVANYAHAALDILSIERYKGSDSDVLDLIEGLPFMFA